MKDFIDKNPLNTIYIGIDVDSSTNVVSILNFKQDLLAQLKVLNDVNGVKILIDTVKNIMNNSNEYYFINIVLESTGIYSFHTATYLSTDEELIKYHPIVYCINPKISASFRKTYIDESKNDYIDSKLLAELSRNGTLDKTRPWKGTQFVALQRLTRHRKHIADLIVAEKNYLISNIFLKFSGLLTAPKEDKPFSDIYGATSSFFLSVFFTTDDIINLPIDELVKIIQDKGNKHFSHPEIVSEKLKLAAKNSYRLDKISAKPISLAISSSFNIIETYKKEIKAIDKGILQLIKGLNETEYNSLTSIPSIGPVLASGIIAEIGSIKQFPNDSAVAKFAGLF